MSYSIQFKDETRKIITNVQKLSLEVPETWPADKQKGLDTLIAKLADEMGDWVVLTPGDTPGMFVLKPGYKLELLERVLKDPNELPKEKPESVFG